MLTAKTKRRFVEMRAEGASYEKIQRDLKISKNSCQKLQAELGAEIDAAKREEMQTLIESFGMVRTARIKQIGNLLKKLDKAIDKADFSKVAADKLLSIRLQYVEAMQKEITLPRETVKGTTPEEILAAYIDLVNEVRSGNMTTEQAAKENSVLAGMLKAVETVQLKKRIEEIERILAED